MEKEIEIITGQNIIPWRRKIDKLSEMSYPIFVLQDNANIDNNWDRIYDDFLDYQVVVLRKNSLAAVANSIPLFIAENMALPDEGWDWALATGYRQFDEKTRPNSLVGLSVMVSRDLRGMGLSKICLLELKKLARAKDLGRIYIPVRPTKKPDFPKMPFEKYINTKINGRYLDPWLNLHYGLGGKFISVCRKSMLTEADLLTWANWTGVSFSESGRYEIPGALEKITVDVKNNTAVYLEPNVWIEHSV